MDDLILDENQIARILPQAYPFIMIDRVIAFEKGESLTAIKNVTGNEWMFQGKGHQTGLFPETMVIEAASQAALVLYQLSKIKEGEQRPKYILGRVTSDFKRPIAIGDQIQIKAYANKMMDAGGYSDIELSVDGEPVAHVEIIYRVMRREHNEK